METANNISIENPATKINHLYDLRAWRLFFTKVFGIFRNIDQYEWLTAMNIEDAMGSLNLTDQEWAIPCWQDIRKGLAKGYLSE